MTQFFRSTVHRQQAGKDERGEEYLAWHGMATVTAEQQVLARQVMSFSYLLNIRYSFVLGQSYKDPSLLTGYETSIHPLKCHDPIQIR